jgi:hypothetical protein
VTGFGSEKIGIFDTNALESGVISKTLVEVGNGPSGIVLDEARNQLYVMNRIDAHDLDRRERRHAGDRGRDGGRAAPLRSVARAREGTGRIFLYDARHTSAHGDQACASCHIFGDFDSLAWDLGDPFGPRSTTTNPFQVAPGGQPIFHPLKGPMTTQSLRGMADAGPMHWRGDRTGASNPLGNALDEQQAFKKFNPRSSACSGARAAERLGDAGVHGLHPDGQVSAEPDPSRSTDAGTTQQNNGATFFSNTQVDAGVLTCAICHDLPLGTDGLSSIEGETQEFKVAHLRNIYQKIGMFNVAGDQVRGFGFLHDGSVDTVNNFLTAAVFNFGTGGTATTNRRNVEAFVHTFDTGLKPIVGQQVSSTPGDGRRRDGERPHRPADRIARTPASATSS